MNVISLDQIVKNILLKRGYSLHWYLDFLVPAKDCLRELCFDENMQTLRYKILIPDTNAGNTAALPADMVDHVRVSVRVDQYLLPLVEDNALDLIPNYDSDFDIQPYTEGVASLSTTDQNYYPNGYLSPYWYMCNINAWGENLGRQFGGTGGRFDTYKIDKTRNEIKINERLSLAEVVIEYISNGMDADSATHINAYAQSCIEAYAMWQFKENNRTYSPGEAGIAKQQYVQERQILRARLSDLSIDALKNIVQSNSKRVKY